LQGGVKRSLSLNRTTIDDAAIFVLANRTRTQSERTRATALSGHAVDAVKLDGKPSLGIDIVELGGGGTTWKAIAIAATASIFAAANHEEGDRDSAQALSRERMLAGWSKSKGRSLI
jgi:hypothetical protein